MDFDIMGKYDKTFIHENMMGPNSMIILEELTKQIPLHEGMRVLDLGCGKGLTSVFLAKEYGVRVFALDLWVTASENYRRFKTLGLEDQIVPIHTDAHNMPFADEYFDVVISVDSYHYYGNNNMFFSEKIRPILKNNGIFAAAFPGMKYEVHDNVPEEMKPYWDNESLSMWHSAGWWRTVFQGNLDDLCIWEMSCFKEAWDEWLSTDNPFAVEDRKMIGTDNGRYMNILGITGIKRE